eukprot:jgi/Picre1/27644/NNA_000608.t1
MLGRVSIASTVVRPGNGTPDDAIGWHARKRESHQSSLQSKDDDMSWKAKKSDYNGRQDTNATVAHAPVVWQIPDVPNLTDRHQVPRALLPKMDITTKADPQKKPLRMAGRRRKALVGVPESLRRKITPSKAKKDGDGKLLASTN